MINEEYGKKKEDESVCCVKSILKTIIETQNKAELPIFQGILPETIPIILYSSATFEPYFSLVLPQLYNSHLELAFSVLKI